MFGFSNSRNPYPKYHLTKTSSFNPDPVIFIHNLSDPSKLLSLVNQFSNKIQRLMKGQHKRCRTPVKLNQSTHPAKKQPTSPAKSASTVMKHEKQNIQSLSGHPGSNLAHTSPAFDISREKCQSPALTTIGTYTNAMTQRHGSIDGQQNLKIALELAEFHKKEIETARAKAAQMEQRINKLEAQIKDMDMRNEDLEERANKYEQKYRKLKQRYRQLKQLQQEKSQDMRIAESPQKNEKREEEIAVKKAQAEENNKMIDELKRELDAKNKSIQNLCQQVSDCEQNTQNILQLVSILEQRVQELTMDNTLLKGLLRERQNSQSEEMSRCHHSKVSGVFGGPYERVACEDIKMVDMRRRRDIMDYGIIHYQDRNNV